MGSKYKQKNNVLNLYEILDLSIDVCKEENCNNLIKNAYHEKAKKFHPDKPSKDPNDKKRREDIYMLITAAYDILRDEKTRNEYNQKLGLAKSSTSDFTSLKQNTSEYFDSIGEFKQATEQQKLIYDQQFSELDHKRGYDRSMESKISGTDASKRLSELAKARMEQDSQYMPRRIFEGNQFDIGKFNAAFDKCKSRDGSVVPHVGVPSEWNSDGGQYGLFEDFDSVYEEGELVEDNISSSITLEEVDSLIPADYTHGHNQKDSEYAKKMKQKLLERQGDSDKFDRRKVSDFSKETSGYGIHDKLGCDFSTLRLDDEQKITKKFNKTLAKEKK